MGLAPGYTGEAKWGHHMDFMPLNKSVVPSQFPLSVPKELFLWTKGSSFYMKLDLVKGYHQIELHPNSGPLTATHTPLGLWQYRHMPFSLVDSGATMQWCIQQALEGLDGVFIYSDDILVFAHSKEANNAILRKVLCHLHAKDFACN